MNKRFFQEFKSSYIDGGVTSNAAKISYYMIFSIFPFIITVLNLASFAGLSGEMVLENFSNIFPEQAFEIVLSVVKDVNQNSSGTLFILSIVVSLWSSSRGILSVIKSINEAYDLKETRGFLRLNLLAIILTIFTLAVIVLSTGLMIFSKKINRVLSMFLGLKKSDIIFINIIKNIIIIFLLTFIFTLLYSLSPNFNKKKDRHIKFSLPGAIFATILWLMASFLFSYYLNNFANYDKTYGSIGGVIITLVWMNISANILLLGGTLNATIKKMDNFI